MDGRHDRRVPGSSPRVWGLRPRSRRPRGARSVHPHACGDYGWSLRESWRRCGSSPRVWGLGGLRGVAFSAGFGSSPRVWGLLRDLIDLDVRHRFIPTRVGTTDAQDSGYLRSPRFIPTRVGTTPVVVGDWKVPTGSSPRVWGLRMLGQGTSASRTVHPHACGDYAHHRGKPPLAHRFIPTRVGTTVGS